MKTNTGQAPTLSRHENGIWYIRTDTGEVLEAYHTEFDARQAYERIRQHWHFMGRLANR